MGSARNEAHLKSRSLGPTRHANSTALDLKFANSVHRQHTRMTWKETFLEKTENDGLSQLTISICDIPVPVQPGRASDRPPIFTHHYRDRVQKQKE
jgi:hypothetical protein